MSNAMPDNAGSNTLEPESVGELFAALEAPLLRYAFKLVQDEDAQKVLDALTAAGLKSTRVGTTGGFLRSGNTTMLIGAAPEETKPKRGMPSTESLQTIIRNLGKSTQ